VFPLTSRSLTSDGGRDCRGEQLQAVMANWRLEWEVSSAVAVSGSQLLIAAPLVLLARCETNGFRNGGGRGGASGFLSWSVGKKDRDQ
jgi:hypothetical protein